MALNRYIFLDVDGVCNSKQWYKEHQYKSGDFDPAVIARLNTLYEYGVQVVISSSWEHDADKPLNDLGLLLPICGHIEHHEDWEWWCRGNGIKKWLDEHTGYPYDSYEYVIIDDIPDMLMSQADNFIQTDRKFGLLDEHIPLIKKILDIED